MAASDAAAEFLSQQHPDLSAEEIQDLAEDAAYHAARKAGARPARAAETAFKVVSEMTWLAEMQMARI